MDLTCEGHLMEGPNVIKSNQSLDLKARSVRRGEGFFSCCSMNHNTSHNPRPPEIERERERRKKIETVRYEEEESREEPREMNQRKSLSGRMRREGGEGCCNSIMLEL